MCPETDPMHIQDDRYILRKIVASFRRLCESQTIWLPKAKLCLLY